MYRESIIVTFGLMMSGTPNATNHPPSSECEQLVRYISTRANIPELPRALVDSIRKENPKECRTDLSSLKASYTGPGVVVTSRGYRQNTLPIRKTDIEYFLDGTLTRRSAEVLSSKFLTEKIGKVDDRVRESIMDAISDGAKRGDSHIATMTEGEYLLYLLTIFRPVWPPKYITSAFSYGRKIRDNINEPETRLPF